MPATAEPGLTADAAIPVYAASLPTAETLLPYLRLIDASGQYTNRGPLVGLLERRMAEALGLPAGSVALAASGTAALQAAVLAAAGRARPGRDLAIVPGYTFAATAHAAQACGYELVFADVDPATWALSPEALSGHAGLHRTGVVIPVAPYGLAFDATGWAGFTGKTGIPVVIDGAACFEAVERDPACVMHEMPVVLSLHATKAFSTAEGGAVLWRDPAKLRRTVEALGFGFTDSRERSVAGPGLNGKLTEYHSAIGLACLDAADSIAAERTRLGRAYADAAADAGFETSRLVGWPMIASNYALFVAPSRPAADQVVAAMGAARIGVRRWYGRGLHREAFFADPKQPRLPVTEDLADRLIGLPVFPGMAADQARRVIRVLRTI